MQKKTGIITHYDVHNHGAHLQLYALSKVLGTLGYEAKALRYKKRMTQNDFADFFGIPVSTLRKWEQGVNPVPEYVFNMMKSILANDITI